MGLHVILFGRLADIAGSSVIVDAVADTDNLVDFLHKKYPALAESKYVIAVDKHIITSNTPLSDESVVALLPPFSGG